ncbi:hypothetical protein QWY84_06460 [Aquisalimonas lutea]|uniref:hypothetical protein n=1 Tax=Aquisalimonas lutea TaxID=1327750 RepID=UPI0025B54C86|nr:hypothetical protein [Aquisalimonas lutea]MDN3517243.1 hypothetical protein [Aquisalimonas lutea]
MADHAARSATNPSEKLQLTERLRTRITDRGEWPNGFLRTLRTAVEEKIARRTTASAGSDEDELESFEQHLLGF